MLQPSGEKKKILQKDLLFDLLLIFALLALSGVFLLLFSLFGKPGSAVRVTVDGKTVAEYPLDLDRTVVLCDGGNLLVIENRSARIEDATCPDLLCKKQGAISRSGEKIICLPHRLSVEIIGKKSEGAPDLVIALPSGERLLCKEGGNP